jgi:hypothetical protein
VDVLTRRLQRRIEHDFPTPGSALEAAKIVSAAHDSERIQPAVVLCGQGDLARLREARDLALLDWRDLLMNAGLAHEDWPDRLDAELGTP